MLWPWHVLITTGIRIITCVKRVLYVLTTCAVLACPRSKVLSSSKLYSASDAVPTFLHVLPRLQRGCSSSLMRTTSAVSRETIFWPWISRLVLSDNHALTVTRFNHCRNTDYHLCCTSLPRVPSLLVRAQKFWAVQNCILRTTPFRSFSTFCHVYNAAVARLQCEQHRLFHVRLFFGRE